MVTQRRTLILLSLFASAIPGRLVAGDAQISLGHDCQLICHGPWCISVLSRPQRKPSLQVLSSLCFRKDLPLLMLTPRLSSIHARHRSLGQLKGTQISACSVRPGTAEDLGSIASDISPHSGSY
ncbi:hypothetical protein H4582DRAFT_232188 [Lactarius indigo]|nr:hypothetical protein H4582DRAFT_232188 [Lactarius indigo]